MSMFSEYTWRCSDCDLEFLGFSYEYQCPACGSEAIEREEPEDDVEQARRLMPQ